MDTTECCIPPGFRFHPTEDELVGYYLKKKVESQKIDLEVIRDIDLYRIEPWDLVERCRIGYEEQKEWYFFSHKDKKYPTGTRTNRATIAGFWKATGRDKAVYDKTKLIGMRKTLVFYKGRAPNGQKSDWIMHEYRLETDQNAPPQEEGWVVCRAFKKRPISQTKNDIRTRESNYFYDQQGGINVNSSISDPLSYNIRHPTTSFLNQTSTSFMCKQETEAENLILTRTDQFDQLPQLESPSLPLIKRPTSSISVVSDRNNQEDDQQKRKKISDHQSNNNKVTADWRTLDKFVASQLSQVEETSMRYEGVDYGNLLTSSSFGGLNGSNSTSSDYMAFMLLENDSNSRGTEDRHKVDEFLNLDSFDIGFCTFDR